MSNQQTTSMSNFILDSLDAKKFWKNLEYLNKDKKGGRNERRKQRKGD